MTLKGNVRESSMIAEFEESLRYGNNVVSGRQGSVDPTRKDYAWLLDTTVIVKPDVHEPDDRRDGPHTKVRIGMRLAATSADASDRRLIAGAANQSDETGRGSLDRGSARPRRNSVEGW